MGWGEEHRRPIPHAGIDARLHLLNDLLVLTKNGTVSPAVTVEAIDRIIDGLVAEIRTLPDIGGPLPSWLRHQIHLLAR